MRAAQCNAIAAQPRTADEQPAKRALIVNDARNSDEAFLVAAAAFCQEVGVTPVVLTIASSDQSAQKAAARAQAVLASLSTEILFDSLVGSGIQSAVGQVARWRHCLFVIMNRESKQPWWRRLRQSAFPSVNESPSDFIFQLIATGSVAMSRENGGSTCGS